jgi:hypothetical protein
MVNEAKIQAAIEGLRSGKYKTLRSAAKGEGVVYTTLKYQLDGGQSSQNVHIYEQVCTLEEEEVLV